MVKQEGTPRLRSGGASTGFGYISGSEAGAHRGSFNNDDRPGQDHPLPALLAEVRGRTELPLIAAAGQAGPEDVAAVLAAGAAQAQLGTAFLRCTESGANPAYKAALAGTRFSSTAITRAFSGRRARSLVNRFVREHEDAPTAYPEINNATRRSGRRRRPSTIPIA